MSSMAEMRSAKIDVWKVVSAVAVALLLGGFIFQTVNNGMAARAAVERQRNNDIALENRTLCEKWGMPAGTQKHTECVADVQAVRERHATRILEDVEPY